MVDFKFAKKQMSFLVIAYGFFCAAVIGLFLWAEDLLFQGMPVISESFAIVSSIAIIRWVILFFIGLPFIAFFTKRQIDQEKLARTDDITGLSNHRQLLEALNRELARAKRYTQELSVMMIDIDNFKSLNDRYGHLAGDQVLQAVGSLLARGTREVDIAGRYGGDEFLLVLPHTGYEEAQRLAWRLWSNVHRYPFRIKGENFHVSISLGISSFRELGEETEGFNLIHQADQAMFHAKNAKHLAREKVLTA